MDTKKIGSFLKKIQQIISGVYYRAPRLFPVFAFILGRGNLGYVSNVPIFI